ncbi:MAG TPA: ABC transporter ATP-binding protein [Clostridiales bacterium]|nr:ABC transporter ATP-binding protein [Clostridiales bacterium]
MSTIVEINSLYKSYGSFMVLNNLSLKFETNKIIGLLGPNGCGKTTLMKILCGLITDYYGDVRIDGQAPGPYTKSIVSYLPEKTYLSDWMRVSDAFDIFSDFYSDFDRAKACELLQRFHLNEHMKLKAMSKGMQEKVHLILAMSRSAKLYVLDEPLSGVDPASRSVILETIISNYNKDSTVLISTHLIYDVEQYFDDIVMMGFGQLIMAGNVDQIRQDTGKSIDEIFREVFRC